MNIRGEHNIQKCQPYGYFIPCLPLLLILLILAQFSRTILAAGPTDSVFPAAIAATFGRISMASAQGSISGQIYQTSGEPLDIRQFEVGWGEELEVVMIEVELLKGDTGAWCATSIPRPVKEKDEAVIVPIDSRGRDESQLAYFTLTLTFTHQSLFSFLSSPRTQPLPTVSLLISDRSAPLARHEGQWLGISRWFHEVPPQGSILDSNPPSRISIPTATLTPIRDFPYSEPRDYKVISRPHSSWTDFSVPRHLFHFHFFQRTFQFPSEMFSPSGTDPHNVDTNRPTLQSIQLTISLDGNFVFLPNPDTVDFRLNGLNVPAMQEYPDYLRSPRIITRSDYTEDQILILEGAEPFCLVNSFLPVLISIPQGAESSTISLKLPPQLFTAPTDTNPLPLQSFTMSCYNFAVGLNFQHEFLSTRTVEFNHTMIVRSRYSIIMNNKNNNNNNNNNNNTNNENENTFTTDSTRDLHRSESTRLQDGALFQFSTSTRILFPFVFVKDHFIPRTPQLINCISYNGDLSTVVVQCVVAHDDLVNLASPTLILIRPGDLTIEPTETTYASNWMVATQIQPLTPRSDDEQTFFRSIQEGLGSGKRAGDTGVPGSAVFNLNFWGGIDPKESRFDPAQPVLLSFVLQITHLEHRFIPQRLEIGFGTSFNDDKSFAFHYAAPSTRLEIGSANDPTTNQPFRLTTFNLDAKASIQQFRFQFVTQPFANADQTTPASIELLNLKIWDPTRQSKWGIKMPSSSAAPCTFLVDDQRGNDIPYAVPMSWFRFYLYADPIFADVTNLVEVQILPSDVGGQFKADVIALHQVLAYPTRSFDKIKSSLVCSSEFLYYLGCNTKLPAGEMTTIFVSTLSEYRVQLVSPIPSINVIEFSTASSPFLCLPDSGIPPPRPDEPESLPWIWVGIASTGVFVLIGLILTIFCFYGYCRSCGFMDAFSHSTFDPKSINEAYEYNRLELKRLRKENLRGQDGDAQKAQLSPHQQQDQLSEGHWSNRSLGGDSVESHGITNRKQPIPSSYFTKPKQTLYHIKKSSQ